jgi:phenylalanyl-tRNA synthetase beta chain
MDRFFGDGAMLAMQNPQTVDQSRYRCSLIPGLLDSLKFNVQNGNFDTKFFEVGRVATKIDGQFHECIAVSCIVLEKPLQRSWDHPDAVDFYDVKGLILPIIGDLAQKIPPFQPMGGGGIWQPYQGGTCGQLNREKFQAHCGPLNVAVVGDFAIDGRVFAAEIIVHPAIFERKSSSVSLRPFGQFPRISRDLSLVVREEETAGAVEGNVLRLARKTVAKDVALESLVVFDVYRGPGIPAGMKNIGITLNYRSDHRTLTDAEIQSAFDGLLAEIGKSYEIRK